MADCEGSINRESSSSRSSSDSSVVVGDRARSGSNSLKTHTWSQGSENGAADDHENCLLANNYTKLVYTKLISQWRIINNKINLSLAQEQQFQRSHVMMQQPMLRTKCVEN